MFLRIETSKQEVRQDPHYGTLAVPKVFRGIFGLRNDERIHVKNKHLFHISPLYVIFQANSVSIQRVTERINLLQVCDCHVENNTPPRWPRPRFQYFMTLREQTLYHPKLKKINMPPRKRDTKGDCRLTIKVTPLSLRIFLQKRITERLYTHKFLLASPSWGSSLFFTITRRRRNLSHERSGDMRSRLCFFISGHSGVGCDCTWKCRSISSNCPAQLGIKDTIKEVKYGCL